MIVLISGATGLVGSKVAKRLQSQGHTTRILTRTPRAKDSSEYFVWDAQKEIIPKEAFENLDGIINLAGENISHGRWTKKQKEKIKHSRVSITRALVKGVQSFCPKPLEFFSQASAIGIYPKNLNEKITETHLLDHDFLGTVCQEWENEAKKLTNCKRICIFRIGVVLGKDGGMLKKLSPLFKMGVGGTIGFGNQKMSWIHLEDLVSIFCQSTIDLGFNGIYNAVSPLSCTNKEFTKAFGAAVKRPTLFPVPPLALKIMMGEMSSIALDSQEIIPDKLIQSSFKFKYPEISKALFEIFN